MAPKMLTFALFFTANLIIGVYSDTIPAIDIEEEEQVTTVHKTDSVTILILLAILLLTILTIWLFKHRRLRFFHETGLSMIYGMVVGVVIRYGSFQPDAKTPVVVLAENETYFAVAPPYSVLITLPEGVNSSLYKTLKYNLWGVVDTKAEVAPIVKAVTFDPEFFFNIMLPFIIFEAGYSMKRRHFFRNFGAIMAYAFIGTTVSCLVVGGIMYGLTRLMDIAPLLKLNDCFFFGAVISATDPVTVLAIFSDLKVDVDLFAFVFGESVLNDAVAIVLSGSVEKYGQYADQGFSANAFFKSLGNFVGIFGGAFAIGSFIGCLTAIITKYTKIRDFPLLETAMFFLMSYSTFQAAEAAGLTGIVAVLFCGIAQAHYTYNNLSQESKTRTKQLFELTNFLAENFVFLYIGVSIFTFQSQKWHAGFIFSTFFAIIVGRFCNIYPLSLLLNLGRRKKIKASFMHMMMFSGLRGAIAFALSIRNTSTWARELMVSATMLVVLVTVIICGGLTMPMLQFLKIRVGVEEETEMKNLASLKAIHLMNDHLLGVMTSPRQRQYSSMDSPVAETPTFSNELDDVFEHNAGSRELPESPLLESGTPQEEMPKKNLNAKAWLVALWHDFDVRFMKPFLTNSRPTLIETLPACCLPLAKLLTTEEQMSMGTSRSEGDSDIDMIIDNSQLSIGGDDQGIMHASQHSNISNDDHNFPTQTSREDAAKGDLGLGHTNDQLSLRVDMPGPPGDQV